jgi:hypothetical protein
LKQKADSFFRRRTIASPNTEVSMPDPASITPISDGECRATSEKNLQSYRTYLKPGRTFLPIFFTLCTVCSAIVLFAGTISNISQLEDELTKLSKVYFSVLDQTLPLAEPSISQGAFGRRTQTHTQILRHEAYGNSSDSNDAFERRDVERQRDKVKSSQIKVISPMFVHTSSLPGLRPENLKATMCSNGFLVVSAHFSCREDGFVEVVLVTSYILWKSDSPYKNPICNIKLISDRTMRAINVNLTTVHHRSSCGLFRHDGFLDNVNRLERRIFEGDEIMCTVDVTRIEKQETIYNLVGVAMIRNPTHLREWLQFHLKQNFNHIVIYDDASRIPIRSSVLDLVDS